MACTTASRSWSHAKPIAWGAAALVIVASTVFLLWHQPLPVLPDPAVVAAQDPFKNMDARIASADALRDLSSLLVTLSFGLAAAVGFAIKDGLGSSVCLRAVNPLLIAVFLYFFARVILYAYEIDGAIAVQLGSGYFFEARIEDTLTLTARSVLWSAIVSIVILSANLLPARR